MIGQAIVNTAPSTMTPMPGNPYKEIYHRRTTGLTSKTPNTQSIKNGVWSQGEHQRFMEALRMFPGGPWRLVAEHVGTRTVRQVQTHMQKMNEKARRHRRGLHKKRKERPASEPIGTVSVISSSSSEDGDSDSGVIFDPICLSPTWNDVKTESTTKSCTITDDQWLFDDAFLSELNLDDLDTLFGSCVETFSC